ncbi:MAG: alkaline phosphatase [Desulfobacterales bacterium]
MKIVELRYFWLWLNMVVVFGCGSDTLVPVAVDSPNTNNIILFIGDGMGDAHRLAARWAAVGETGTLSMDSMPAGGWAMTGAADNPITDSAAAATAMASGVKTDNGVVGMDAELNIVSTLLEEAKKRGKTVGLVTTTQLSHATPAAFAAHVANRNLMTDIAEQIMDAEVDVLLGGGEDEFLPASEAGCFPEVGERTDGRNLIDEAISAGYTFVCDPVALSTIDPIATVRLLGLFADEGMTRPFSPTLAGMTQKAIDILSKSSKGFFLMVEGGQIDWASHSNDAQAVISDTIELDKAVKLALAHAAANEDTLVIATADHETGGMQVSLSPRGASGEDGPFAMPDGTKFYVNWSTTGHTSTDVPVTGRGPFSDMLNGFYENTHIFDVMLRAID